MRQVAVVILAWVLIGQAVTIAVEPQLAELEQQALREATNAVADSVVQIRTVGGLDRVGKTLLAQGPTTGLIVTQDGYIVSSAFNFAGEPTSILVRLAEGQQLAAELIARDKNRMLVLLKVNAAAPLPVPQAALQEEMRVGQWAVALGRTFQAEQVGVSVGIVSALKRMYGRVIQTDASVSVANYGGPLVDISGRVLGVLVPMSPQASSGGTESELAGAEYYDSGIGFAVPLEEVLGILPSWKQGEDLLSGKLGVGLESGDAHFTPPKIVSIWPNSPAAKAGWKPNDLILVVDGKEIATQAQLRFQIIPKYAGETVSVTLLREEKELQTRVTLTGKLDPFRHAFLGVLPERSSGNSKSVGAAVRRVWPESPADEAGLEPGDQITKINETVVKTTPDAFKVLAGLHPEEAATVVVVRKEEELTLTAVLKTLPEEILSTEALRTDSKESQPQQEDKQREFEKLKLPEFAQEAVYFLPVADNDQRFGMLMWLGDGIAEHNHTLLDSWQATCRRDGIILLIAPPAEESSWRSDDLPYLERLLRSAVRRLKVDGRRLAIAGQGKAGQLAYALAIKQRRFCAGVIGIDAPLPRTLKLPDQSPSSRLAVLAIESRNSNFAPLIRRDVQQLRRAGYPTSWQQRPPTSDVTLELDKATRANIAQWLDGLDRF